MQGGSGWLSPPQCIAPVLLLTVGVMLNSLMALDQVQNGLDEAQYSVKLIKKNYIYGNINHDVNVYVKVHRDSPFLVCMDVSLAQSEVIDPNYLWIGPDGQTLKGKSYVNLTETGKLMVHDFREHMSGPYTCTLTYRVFRNDMQVEQEKVKAYKFMVYAYREPDYTYRISVHFTTKECSLAANQQFFEELKKILNNLISYLTCHIIEPAYKCYSVKRPNHGLVDELFVVFEVNPFAPGWEAICHHVTPDCEDVTNSRVQKARLLIEEFFRRQQYILKDEYENIPVIHYIDHSFQVTRLDSCRPGFGKNDVIHNDCANCCVACDPGSYSPNNNVVCQTCTSIRIKYYGAKSC
ncbi:zona pellucida-binding protein 2 [Varanus komodoensis]|uniref:zona pellucida-binding protein 2 n=1 Tax=Varanus komodoensis TaxID=61221 RepID=UPI001CF7D469|nr:zona pellucida-binding protein 2 [Varanus komodoensis]